MIFGFGITTLTPGLARSAQSLMPFGLPLRTRITVVDEVGALLSGSRLAQSAAISLPRLAIASMSLDWFIVTTSASRPSITERACLLEPPCDWFSVMSSPAVAFQWRAKAAL